MIEKIPVIFGEVLFDDFEDGSRVLGGAPFNVAWHLQAFGCNPLFISRVGNDALGDEVRNAMQAWGMRTDGLQKDDLHATGVVSVQMNDGQPSYDITTKRAYDFIHASEIPVVDPALIYHGSLGLREPASASALEQLLQQSKAPVFVDVNLRAPWWKKEQVNGFLSHARWVKINDEELHVLVEGQDTLQRKARKLLQSYDLEYIILTLGAEGACLLDNQENLFDVCPVANTQVVDTVGAGDAFASVCMLGLLHDWPPELAMDRAQQFASRVVGQRGATAMNLMLYQSLITDWKLDI